MSWDDARARAALRRLFDAAAAAADPRVVLARHLPERPREGRVIVLGAGKASALMARALEEAWPEVPLSGLVVTRYGHAVACGRVEILEASHPVPDANSALAGERMLALAGEARPGDLVLVLLSGGGSALLVAPAEGMTLEDKRAVNAALLASGAPIDAMNAVRKHLSRVKGGRLAAACGGARVVTLAISDVPGDEAAVIASGPTVADPSTWEAARAVVRRYGLVLPEAATRVLEAGGEETPKAGDARLARAEFRMIATPQMALEAMAAEARALGLTPVILGDALQGEARAVGAVLADIARGAATHGHPAAGPCVLLSGGETTVTLRGGEAGNGGRNTECALGAARALHGLPGVWALCADTDGIDGLPTERGTAGTGAFVTPDTLARLAAAGWADEALTRQRTGDMFEAVGDLLVTGPTLTNVNDVRAFLVAGVGGAGEGAAFPRPHPPGD